jgi:glyoxalase superfamily protein
MGVPVGLVLDCADPARVGNFWPRALGATVVRRNQDPDDWVNVMQDPEGNEFCLV